MVPRHDIAGNHHRRRIGGAERARGLARRNHRHGQARLADGDDAARPGRHDDDRPCPHRAARRCRHRRGQPRAADPVRRLRVRHGSGVRGRPTGGASLRREGAAHGAPRAARGPVGRRDDRRPGQHRAALGRGHSPGRRAIVANRSAGGPLSRRIGVVDDPRLVLHRAAQLHGRGQSSRAGAVDHARRHSLERPARVCAHLRRLRAAAARSARGRARDHDHQSRHVRGRALDLLYPAPIQEIPRARRLLAGRLGADAQAHGRRRSDLGRPDAGMGAVHLVRAAGGLARNHRPRRPPDRAAGGDDPVHGPLRRLARRDRTGRARSRAPRPRGHATRRFHRHRPGRRPDGGDDRIRHRIPLRDTVPLPGRRCIRARRHCPALRHAAADRRDLLRCRRSARRRRRRIAGAQRHARADAVCGNQLLADRLHQRLCAGLAHPLGGGRHLDRVLDRHCDLRGTARPAVSPPH
jgi:hypothetical protein